MVTLADFSDTASLVNCSRCGQLLQEGDRFCRFCGHEQEISTDAQVITLTDSPEAFEIQPVASTASRSRAASQGPPLAMAAEPADRPPPGRTTSSPARWVLGIAVVVLLVLAAALLHDLYRNEQDDSTRRAELGTALAQVEAALARGDLNEVQLKLAILDALNPNDPEVKARRDAFERRVQEMTAERDRLRAAAAKEQGSAPRSASRPPAPAETAPAAAPPAPPPAVSAAPAHVEPPAPAPAPAPTPAPSAAAPPAPRAPAPAAPPAPATAACPEALAALALCSNR